MGGDHNSMIIVTDDGADTWPKLSKEAAARRLAAKISEHFR